MCRYFLIFLMISISFLVACDGNLDEYKERSSTHSSADFIHGEVDGGSVVKINGEISAYNGEAFVLTDSDGVFYVKDENEAGGSFSDGDNVTVYGQYIGDDAETGFPKVVGKIIE